jgi:hypothetical protein
MTPAIEFTRLPDAHAVTMATPRHICVEVFEPEIRHGGRFEMDMTGEERNAWVERINPSTGDPDLGMVMGSDFEAIRFGDKVVPVFFERDAVLNAAGYGTIGGRTVTKVSLKNYMQREGHGAGLQGEGDVARRKITSFRWYVYLFLDGDLAQGGPYTIQWPDGSGINDKTFTFDDKVTRAHFLHTTYLGHRPNDVYKNAVFGGVLPRAAEHGRIDASDYSITEFDIIDEDGNVVFGPEPVTLHAKASDGIQFLWMSTTDDPIHVTDIDAGTPAVVHYSEESWAPAEDEEIMFRGVQRDVLRNNGDPGVTYFGTLIARNVNAGARTFELWCHIDEFRANLTEDSATVEVLQGDFAEGDLVQFKYPTTEDWIGDEWEAFYSEVDTRVSHTELILADVSPTTLSNKRVRRIRGVTMTGDYTTGTMIPWSDEIWRTVYGSMFNTYLYDCDYSDFAPTERGMYRVRIPGVGVSYPIPIHHGVWHEFGAHASKGEYHMRSGLELDGRFGYSRAACQKNGEDCTIYQSTFPMVFLHTNQFIFHGPDQGALYNSVCGVGVNITDTEVDWWGEWHDAGDWDIFTANHAICTAYLASAEIMRLDLGGADTVYNIPQAQDVCDPSYPANLPDQLNQALWGVNHLLRLQDEDGGVPGGLEGVSPYGLYGNGFTGEGPQYGPSFSTGNQWFMCPPDEVSNYSAAGNMALVSICFALLGHTAWATTYYQAAKAAFDFAEALYEDTIPGFEDEVYRKAQATLQIPFEADTTNGQFTLANCSTVTGILPGMEITDIFNFSGTVTEGSDVITNIDSVEGITVGSNIRGNFIPGNTTVESIDSSSQITISALPVNISGTNNNVRLRTRHTTPLPYTIDGNDQAWENQDGNVPPYADATVESIDGDEITFKNWRKFDEPNSRGAKSTTANVKFIARYPAMGWSEAMFNNNLVEIRNRVPQPRALALGALFRAAHLEGETVDKAAFKTLFETRDATSGQYVDSFGFVQYCCTPGADSAKITEIRAGFDIGIENLVGIDDLEDGPYSPARGYRSIGGIETPQAYGPVANQNLSQWLVQANFLAQFFEEEINEDYMHLLQATYHSDHGANQHKVSTMMGLGPHRWANLLHEDSELMGVNPPDGISAYGRSGVPFGAFPTVYFSVHAMAPDSVFHDYCDDTEENVTNLVYRRCNEPPTRARPQWEYGTMTKFSIPETEFTVQQSVMIKQYSANYLHCWDQNTVLHGPKHRLRANWSTP